MRNKIKWLTTSDMFGHKYVMTNGTDNWDIPEVQENEWTKNQKQVKKFYWFRSPKITVREIESTLGLLGESEGKFNFEVWETDGKFDASLKVENHDDATNIAWTLTETWMKWSKESENEFKASLKPQKPLKAKIDKNGNLVVKGKVTVASLGN
jgi:hypothetical protein